MDPSAGAIAGAWVGEGGVSAPVEGDNSTFAGGAGNWTFYAVAPTTGSIAADAGGMRITKSGNNQVYTGVIVTPIPGEQYRFAVEVIENGGGASVALRVITGT